MNSKNSTGKNNIQLENGQKVWTDISSSNHMKRCSTSLAIRKLKIKTTWKYLYIPIRMTKIKNSGNTKCWQGSGENESHHSF